MGRGRDLALLRQSNAAGLHVKWSRDRANAEREAIEQELDSEEDTGISSSGWWNQADNLVALGSTPRVPT